MKRLLWAGCAAMLVVAFGSPVFATASLELVSGSSTLYVSDNGSVTCSGAACGSNPSSDQNSLTGGIALAGVVFGGYSFTITSGGSNSPNCTGVDGPGCLNTTNINGTNISSGTATVSMYFADTNFTVPGSLIVGFSTPGETGNTATQTAFATLGSVNTLGSGVTDPTVGLTGCGTPSLTITGPVANTSMGTGCGVPGASYSLMLATTMTTNAGGAFNLNGTISAVPEPAAVLLMGTVLALCSFGLRRWRRAS